MKTRLLICICILAVHVYLVPETYACCQYPVADVNISPATYDPVYDKYYVCAGQELTFDGTGSYDPDSDVHSCAEIDSWLWHFGDGTPDKEGETTTHTYTTAGTYYIYLRVKDNDSFCCCPSGDPYCYDKYGYKYTTVTVVEVDLMASDLYGTVAESDEEVPGAFIHFNLDNDNSSDNNVPSSKHPGADYAETTSPVIGEDDLKFLALSMSPLLDKGVVVLTNTTNGVLWNSDTKGSDSFFLGYGSVSWNLSDPDERDEFIQRGMNFMYMEGANGTGSGEVVLRYYEPGGSLVDSDKVKIVVTSQRPRQRIFMSGVSNIRSGLKLVDSNSEMIWRGLSAV